MARNRYWVVPSNSDWNVRHDDRILSRHLLKSEAVTAGTKAAKANTPSQLTILLANGRIEKEYTYGDDPHPPQG